MKPVYSFIMMVAVGCALASASDEVPGKPQDKPMALMNAKIYTISGAVIDNGILVFDQGKIVGVGSDINIPANATKIDCAGKSIYPGLIDAASELGLIEIDSVRSTRDTSETGTINPNARAEVAVNPDSELIPVGRANGILIAMTSPAGGTISGTAALIQLDGWTWEDLTLKSQLGMVVNWPAMSAQRAWFMRDTAEEQNRRRDDALKAIQTSFDDARAYWTAAKSQKQPEFDVRWNAMIPVLEGKVPLIVKADDVSQIRTAVAFAEKEKVKLIISGGYDAPLCADLLKKYDVPVIIDGIQRSPRRRNAPYDEAFTVPLRLQQAGIRYCIAADRGASLVRNLPYHAATAAAFGLSVDEALKSITLYPAQIFGVADRVGSLEAGKDATLIVCSGDILETPTHVEQAWIQGRSVDLSNRQTKLWEKYKEKYRRQPGNGQASR